MCLPKVLYRSNGSSGRRSCKSRQVKGKELSEWVGTEVEEEGRL